MPSRSPLRSQAVFRLALLAIALATFSLARPGRTAGTGKSVWAWGHNNNGQLGIGSFTTTGTGGIANPTEVPNSSGAVAVAGGGGFSLELTSDGTVSAWGYNGEGELGNGSFSSPSASLGSVTGLSGVIAIAGGSGHSLALKSDGTVWAWGNNGEGELGNGNFTTTGTGGIATPAQVVVLSSATAVAAGAHHSLALRTDGTVWAWGNNAYGQLGNGSFTTTGTGGIATPAPVTGLSGVVAIGCGSRHSLALKSDGTVWAWGYNGEGELGNGSFTTTGTGGIATPSPVPGLSGVTAIASGLGSHSLALKSDGTVWGWGYNAYGQLGNGSFTTDGTGGIAVPASVTGLSGVEAIAEGSDHSLALRSDGSVWAWGYNVNGEVGNGTFTPSAPYGIATAAPVQMEVIAVATAIAAGGDQSLAILDLRPVPAEDQYSTYRNQTLNVDAAHGVLANDIEPDGDPMTAALGTGPAHGGVTLNPDGSFSYVPTAGYTGSDSFSYTASDGRLTSDPVLVRLTIVDRAPIGQADSYSVHKNGDLVVTAASGVLANDSDPDGDALTAVLSAGPSHGALTLGGNGAFEYIPSAGFTGLDSFTYLSSDGVLASSLTTASISVTNTAPVAVNDSYSTWSNCPLAVPASGVLGNDTDADGDALTASLVSGPSHGAVTLNADGSFTYTPAAGYTGSDSFTYQASDGMASSNTATVSLTVQADTTAPAVSLTATIPGPPVQVQITARDLQSGIQQIMVMQSTNCTVNIPSFTPGTTAPIVVTATKTVAGQRSVVALRVIDCSGNVTNFDPVLAELVIPTGARAVTRTFSGVLGTEHVFTATNGRPGVQRLAVSINGSSPKLVKLDAGDTKTLELTGLKAGDSNTVTVSAVGPAGARVAILIGEGSSAGPGSRAASRRLPLGLGDWGP